MIGGNRRQLCGAGYIYKDSDNVKINRKGGAQWSKEHKRLAIASTQIK